jgi:cell filamentation protein
METMKNKLGITDAVELAHAEERVSKAAAIRLYRDGTLDTLTPGTFATLQTIHVHLFGDLYDFAGKLRSVNLAKGGFRFASALYLNAVVAAVECMPQDTFDQIVEKYVEMNVAHPFREGNGRSGRIWLDHMLRSNLHVTVDWSAIEREDYLLAMERSPVRDTEIKALLRHALSYSLDSIDLIACGIDASYAFEGFATYHTEGLISN